MIVTKGEKTEQEPSMNHLENEKSPYLLQHRENPVDWFPWGTEAFEKAKREEKPVFLSIGYSTCHWCHVMAHESFEDDEVARLLNRSFVPVKVDREERPDVDAVYMAVCQAVTGGGGWPMTILLTPDKKPFFAGTYLPKNSRYGMTGLIELLEQTTILWKNDRTRLIQTGQTITEAMNCKRETPPAEDFESLVNRGVQQFKESFDDRYGGFGSAPKFPAPHNLIFLLEYGQTEHNRSCLNMLEKTLDFMARGGMFDHIGGGFSRYSTDDRWLVPHFEKMLYDNAWLAHAYALAYAVTQKTFYKEITARIVDYISRELTGAEGGFYCGQDADSEGSEGRYYVFSRNELSNILGADADAFCHWYGITEAGNFEGRNIPNLLQNENFEHTPENIVNAREQIYVYRKKRMPLHLDDKILTSWNAMMISACAKAGFLLNEPAYTEMAQRSQRFIENHLYNENGRLMVRYREGESAFLGNLDDYAYYCLALIDLYETTFHVPYLRRAAELAERMIELFWDTEEGGFYFYGIDDEELIHRPKEVYDGAVPSGNSVSAHVLHWLFRLTGETKWMDAANRQLDFLASNAAVIPSGHSFSLLAFQHARIPSKELVCVSNEKEAPGELLAALRDQTGIQPAVIFKNPENASSLLSVAPFTENYPFPESGTQYYLCEGHRCSRPFSDISQLHGLS